jgi:hypothetical protein
MSENKSNKLERFSPATQNALLGLRSLTRVLLQDGLYQYLQSKLREAMGEDRCYCGENAKPLVRLNPFTGDPFSACDLCKRTIQFPPKEIMSEEEVLVFVEAAKKRADALKAAIDDALKYSVFHP